MHNNNMKFTLSKSLKNKHEFRYPMIFLFLVHIIIGVHFKFNKLFAHGFTSIDNILYEYTKYNVSTTAVTYMR